MQAKINETDSSQQPDVEPVKADDPSVFAEASFTESSKKITHMEAIQALDCLHEETVTRLKDKHPPAPGTFDWKLDLKNPKKISVPEGFVYEPDLCIQVSKSFLEELHRCEQHGYPPTTQKDEIKNCES